MVLYDYGQKAIVSLALVPTVATSMAVLFDDEDYPHLSSVGSLSMRDYANEGRKLLLRKQYAETWVSANEVFTVIPDSDNDGVFEIPLFFDVTAFEASPYHQWSSWKEFWRMD